MATLTKKRPAPPEEEYEMEEGPDDEGEIRESSAGRKRRPKRSMDGDCSCGKRKGKCDGSCGKTMKDGGMYKKPMMDRGDALTPQEYLAACDLGIQGQPRSYIRARLDYAERLDLKCGKGAIPEGKKCTKGPATRVEGKKAPGRIERRGLYGTSGLGGDPFSRRNMANKGAMLNAAGGAALGALVGGGKGALIGGLAGAAGGALSGAGQAQLNRVTSRAAKRRRLTGAKGKYGVDSMWADGFDPTDSRSDLKCGKGSISPGEKCTKGAATKATGKRQPGRTAKSVGKVFGAVSALSTAAKAAGAVNAARRGNIAGAIGVGIQAAGQAKATREYWQGRIGKGLATEVAGNVAGLGTEIGLRSLNRTARSPGAQNAARRAGEATGRAVGGLRGRMRGPNTVSGESLGSGTSGRYRRTAGQQMYRATKGASYAAGRAAGSVARMGRRRSRAVPYGSGMPLARRGDAIWADGFSPEPVQLAV
jgi:hypothetical protein